LQLEPDAGLVEDLLTEIETAPDAADEDADAGEGDGGEDDGEESPPTEEEGG